MIAYDMGKPVATLRAVPYEDPKAGSEFSKKELDLLNEAFDFTKFFNQMKGVAYFIDIVAIIRIIPLTNSL